MPDCSVSKIKIRDRGQFTLPKRIRESLAISESSSYTIVTAGRAIILIPEPTAVDEIARSFEEKMSSSEISLDDLLNSLREGNHSYVTD